MNNSAEQQTSPPAHGEFAFRIALTFSRGLVSIAGELDREHSPQLAVALSNLAETSHEVWSIDAARVTFCDASGLRALAAGAAAAGDHGCRLRITANSRCVQRLVTLVGLSHLLLSPEPGRPQQPLPGPVLGSQSVPARLGDRAAAPRSLPTAEVPAGDDPVLTIRIDNRQGSLQLTGQLDRWNVHLLQDSISVLLISDRERWTADVTALAVVDHAGLRAIGTAYRRLLRNGRRLSLRGAS